MIIKGLFRRYERWNPVHPTFGAFWGMGVGFGCGVGWGPGFGPEVVGYVGAGCGVGFSVGITLFGLGIGLPANNIFEVPYNAIVATRRHALPFVQSGGLLSGDGWNNIAPSISVLHRETSRRFSSLNKKVLLDNGVDLFKMQSKLNVQAKSFSKDLETLCSRFFHYREDLHFPPGRYLVTLTFFM
ncbi:Cadmium-induced protein AS8, putative [Ricinus communis]|uniref:Cadmium-induced protein AS8, putative n=1 Tax=Ricinus communis TaxID=3988 RepID=B9S1K0_RICCO|nr:Cadmium-induced protein AS8, putative [Ricinus communis]